MSHRLAALRLSTGELWVILNELNMGGGLLGAEEALLAQADADQAALLRAGRDSLVARGLLMRDDAGRQSVASSVRALIERSSHPEAAIWLIRNSGTGAPAQTYIALSADGGVAYRPDPAGVHDFISVPNPSVLTALTQAGIDPLPACDGIRPRVWLAPTAVLGRVAEGTDGNDDDQSHVSALIGCGFSAHDATAFVAAVAESELRGALTGFALGRSGISLTWLGHAGAIWTVRLDGDSGLSLLRRCGGEAARQQAAAVAVDIAELVWHSGGSARG